MSFQIGKRGELVFIGKNMKKKDSILILGKDVLTKRKQIKVNYNLPMKNEFDVFLTKLITNPIIPMNKIERDNTFL